MAFDFEVGRLMWEKIKHLLEQFWAATIADISSQCIG